jgi:hypothetical protein
MYRVYRDDRDDRVPPRASTCRAGGVVVGVIYSHQGKMAGRRLGGCRDGVASLLPSTLAVGLPYRKGSESMQLLEFHNLVFVLPMLGASLFIMLLGVGGAHAESGVHGGGVGHDVAGHDAGAHEVPVGIFSGVLTFLGIGNVPIMLNLVILGLLWGMAGLFSNALLTDAHLHLATSMSIAGTAALLGNGLIARLIQRFLPSVETYGEHERELVSEYANVLHEVTELGGTARTRDRFGNMRDVTVLAHPGSAPMPLGSRIILTEYLDESGTFRAKPADSDVARPV